MKSEIILGLDWLMSNKVNVDLSIMVLTFLDLSTKPCPCLIRLCQSP